MTTNLTITLMYNIRTPFFNYRNISNMVAGLIPLCAVYFFGDGIMVKYLPFLALIKNVCINMTIEEGNLY